MKRGPRLGQVSSLRPRRVRVPDPLRGRRALPIRDRPARVPVRASNERVDARRGERGDPAAHPGQSEVQVHLVFLPRLSEVPRRGGVGEGVEKGGVGGRGGGGDGRGLYPAAAPDPSAPAAAAAAAAAARGRRLVDGRSQEPPPEPAPEWVDPLPQEPPTAQPAVVRGQVAKRRVIVILDVHHHHGLHPHALAEDVDRDRVEVAAVHEEIAGFIVAHGG